MKVWALDGGPFVVVRKSQLFKIKLKLRLDILKTVTAKWYTFKNLRSNSMDSWLFYSDNAPAHCVKPAPTTWSLQIEIAWASSLQSKPLRP